jgi:stage II sporulation protein D
MKHLTLVFIFIFHLIWNCQTVPILKHKTYKPPIDSDNIRVLLSRTDSEIHIKSPDSKFEVFDINDLLIKKTYDSISLDPKSLKAPIRIEIENGIFEFKGKRYKGEVVLHPQGNDILVINIVPLETYLLSVVPSEMPPSWPEEALKAQAVCARTYVIREKINRKSKPFDVDSSTASQVYGGLDKEHARTTKAVRDTSGLILLYDEEPIYSFFHSNSGGMTESPDNVWGGKKLDYLPIVSSEFCKLDNQYSWEKNYSKELISSKLQSLKIGMVEDIVVTKRTESNRADLIEITGTEGSKSVKGNEFRKMMGNTDLKSLRFRIDRSDNGFLVRGFGSGHGVGLSQWGSHQMAKQRLPFRDILEYYFRGVEFAKLD